MTEQAPDKYFDIQSAREAIKRMSPEDQEAFHRANMAIDMVDSALQRAFDDPILAAVFPHLHDAVAQAIKNMRKARAEHPSVVIPDVPVCEH